MSASLSARWSAPQLLTSLSAAGWGELSGAEWQGVRSVLSGLVARLPHKSAQGLTTAEQVAAAAGLSERWTRRCLDVLESIGLIEWRRGGVVSGKPQPSFLRIIKRRLVELIEEARPERARAIAARRARTAARLAGLRKLTVKPRRLKVHAELNTSHLPHRGGDSVSPTPGPVNQSPKEVKMIDYDEHRLPMSCRHGEPRGPRGCPLCKLSAQTADQRADYEAAQMVHYSRPAQPAEVAARGIEMVKAALAAADERKHRHG